MRQRITGGDHRVVAYCGYSNAIIFYRNNTKKNKNKRYDVVMGLIWWRVLRGNMTEWSDEELVHVIGKVTPHSL